jgi:hypothetical protein
VNWIINSSLFSLKDSKNTPYFTLSLAIIRLKWDTLDSDDFCNETRKWDINVIFPVILQSSKIYFNLLDRIY